jgi:hypothetical protein
MTSSTPHAERRRGTAIALALALVCSASGRAAWASPQAEALFETGKRLLDEGRIGEACRAFEESFALDPLGGTLLGLAICHEKERKLGTAFREYQRARDVALAAGRDDRVERATRALASLEQRVPRVIVDVPSASRDAGVEVQLDGVPLAPDEWNTALPVDGGTHRITWRAPGHESGAATFEAREGERAQVHVALGRGASAEATGGDGMATTTVAGLITGGAGVACLGVGAVLGVVALGHSSDSDDACDLDESPPSCTREGLDAFETGGDFALAADVTLATGVAMIGASAVLLLWPASSDAQARTPWIRVEGGAARARVVAGGRF